MNDEQARKEKRKDVQNDRVLLLVELSAAYDADAFITNVMKGH